MSSHIYFLGKKVQIDVKTLMNLDFLKYLNSLAIVTMFNIMPWCWFYSNSIGNVMAQLKIHKT